MHKLVSLAWAGCILFLSACVMPANLEPLLNDEAVQDIITARQGQVNLIDLSDDRHLRAGNGRITGLRGDSYYMVEELNPAGVSLGYSYVTAGGTRFLDLGGIDRAASGLILNLNNDHTYRVRPARALYPDGTSISYITLEPGGLLPAAQPGSASAVMGGRINLARADQDLYINLAPLVDPEKRYEVMLVPRQGPRNWGYMSRVSGYFNLAGGSGTLTSIINSNYVHSFPVPSKDVGIYQYRGTPNPAYLGGMSLVPFLPADGNGDYIILEYNNEGGVSNFAYLGVQITGTSLSVDVEFDFSDRSPVVSYTGLHHTPGQGPGTLYFMVNNAVEFDNFDTDGIEWYVDGQKTSEGEFFAMSFALPAYGMIGVYDLTVIASRAGVPYSTTMRVTVSP
ncbi:MAG: hypothetical protein FWH12_03455 [Treponema sp.]|nr:hypothetical protein [Treponema sp.]